MDQLPEPGKVTLRMLESGKTRAAVFQAYRDQGMNPEEHFPMQEIPTIPYRAKRVSLQVWITPELRQKLKVIAAQTNSSTTDMVRSAIEGIVKGHEAYMAYKGDAPESTNAYIEELVAYLRAQLAKK